ncbi:hypothetical protein TSAR_012637 [Trichomalopsis sarcophagae]|uniref:Uncharacterized protein n=1 Tax=Trichomalopsis sarcophagae TaxID=543379 RepID=A0A232F0T3_9HYME|nr:hypothetical protein TSAR_012637 [Trichomalopsis sarcophagae]
MEIKVREFIPAEAEIPAGDKKKEDAGKVSTEDAAGMGAESTTEELAVVQEMNEVREKVRLERIINEGLRRYIEQVKKERIMDKNRMNELELVIEELLEKGRDTLGKEQNVENNNNNNEEKESVRGDGAGEKEEGELDIGNSEEENNNNKGGGLGNIKRNYLKKVRAIGGGLVVELESMENKIEVMRKRGMLKGMNVWIEDDLTERDKEIQNWLKMIAEEERGRGLETQVAKTVFSCDTRYLQILNQYESVPI